MRPCSVRASMPPLMSSAISGAARRRCRPRTPPASGRRRESRSHDATRPARGRSWVRNRQRPGQPTSRSRTCPSAASAARPAALAAWRIGAAAGDRVRDLRAGTRRQAAGAASPRAWLGHGRGAELAPFVAAASARRQLGAAKASQCSLRWAASVTIVATSTRKRKTMAQWRRKGRQRVFNTEEIEARLGTSVGSNYGIADPQNGSNGFEIL